MKKYPSLETVLIEGGFGPRLVEYAKAQGLKKGLETGKEQGLEKGKEIIARNLLKMGMPIEDIAQAVELPVEKIRAFEDNI
jgi:predicted transposase/invertase (TIGR01784 family)